MANKQLFKSAIPGKTPRPVTTDEKGTPTRNEAGGLAYAFTPEHALAQYATTGCLSNTFYASGEMQLQAVLEFAGKVDSEFLARTALYAREQSFMKDMPALLLAVLFARAKDDVQAAWFFRTIFHRVVTNGRMLRNFVQIVRSGVTGRKSLGTIGRKQISEWFALKGANRVFYDSVGNDPSMANIIKLVHPKPVNDEFRAVFGYLTGLPSKDKADATQLERGIFYNPEQLPTLVRQYEAFKTTPAGEVPAVPFQMLTQLPLTTDHWKSIALNGGWHMVRMNLNTFARHGVLKDKSVVKALADKLRDPEAIQRAKVFPYQLMMAYMSVNPTGDGIPIELTEALQDALEIATQNVPKFEGNVWVFPDVSGSMASAVTGGRRGMPISRVRCIDIAALVSACVLRSNPQSRIIPVDDKVYGSFRLNPRDSVMTNAKHLASFGGGGTALSTALQHILDNGNKADLVIYVSDNMSWADSPTWGQPRATRKEQLWQQVRAKNPNAKMVNIDIQPSRTAQAPDGDGVLNIGGFSDNVWDVIKGFVSGDANTWVNTIRSYGLSLPVSE